MMEIQGKSIFVQVSARLESASVQVIGGSTVLPTYLKFFSKCWNFKPCVLFECFYMVPYTTVYVPCISYDHNFVLKVEIPKHELEHNEAAIEEEDHTQFEVDLVMFSITSTLSLGFHDFIV